MKKILKTTILIVLFILYMYILAIDAIPDSLILFDGEKLNIKTIARVRNRANTKLPSNTNIIKYKQQ